MPPTYPSQANKITLSSAADGVLSVTAPGPGQQIGLDTQTANTVFAGPTSGGAATPTFRAAVGDDLPTDFTKDVKLTVAGKGFYVKEGANCTMGTAVLVGGTVTVSTTKVTASSRIFLTAQVLGGVQGMLSVGTVTAATSFVINSSDALDTSTVAWIIIEPA